MQHVKTAVKTAVSGLWELNNKFYILKPQNCSPLWPCSFPAHLLSNTSINSLVSRIFNSIFQSLHQPGQCRHAISMDCAFTHTNAHKQALTTHPPTHPHKHTHLHTHIHTCTHAHALTHTYTRSTHTHTHTHTHTCTHKHTHTHTQTHTHTWIICNARTTRSRGR